MPTQVGQNSTAPKRGQNDSLAVGCHAQSLSSSTTSRRTGLTETVAVPISLAQTTRSVAAKVFSGLAAFTSVTGQRSPVVLAWWVLSFIRACCGAAVEPAETPQSKPWRESVMNAVTRQPIGAGTSSLSSGVGRSLRRISRVPGGHAAHCDQPGGYGDPGTHYTCRRTIRSPVTGRRWYSGFRSRPVCCRVGR